MNYDALRAALLELERQIAIVFPCVSCGSFIRSGCSPVQGYALDDSTVGRSLPVVVALGINYTQGSTCCPRCPYPSGMVAVEDDLSSCRRHLNTALGCLNSNSHWESCEKSNIPCCDLSTSTEPGYHLVMTNFCLWNTTVQWQKVPKATRGALLSNNPPFAQNPTTAPSWPHLQTLAQTLAPEPALWVIHGLHSGAFDLFKKMTPALPAANWIMTPNLGFPYYHYGKHYPRP